MQSRATHVAIIAGMTAIAIALVAIMASWIVDSGVGRALVDGSPMFAAASADDSRQPENLPATPGETASSPPTYR